MSFRASLAILALLLLGEDLLAYTLVRRNGTRLRVQAAPEYHDGTAYFTLPNGLFGFMPEEDVDRKRTERVNAPRQRAGRPRPRAPSPPPTPRVYTNVDLVEAAGPDRVFDDPAGAPAPQNVVKGAAPAAPADPSPTARPKSSTPIPDGATPPSPSADSSTGQDPRRP